MTHPHDDTSSCTYVGFNALMNVPDTGAVPTFAAPITPEPASAWFPPKPDPAAPDLAATVAKLLARIEALEAARDGSKEDRKAIRQRVATGTLRTSEQIGLLEKLARNNERTMVTCNEAIIGRINKLENGSSDDTEKRLSVLENHTSNLGRRADLHHLRAGGLQERIATLENNTRQTNQPTPYNNLS